MPSFTDRTASEGQENKQKVSRRTLGDITDQRFGKLAAFEISHRNKYGQVLWSCVCDCGRTVEALCCSLICGHTTSCGCKKWLHRIKHGAAGRGNRRSREYSIWASMIQRCMNLKCKAYRYYGARGIKVCERWLNSFEAFLADMGLMPNRRYSIERLDVDGDYCPENCVWLLLADQWKNKTRPNGT